MINAITSGISKALYKEFGSDYEIYKEDMPQNFKEPCFSIVCLRFTNEMRSPSRYFRRHQLDIHFFPEQGQNEKQQIYDAIGRLYSCLEHIYVLDNLCRASKMSPEIVEGVLHFFVDYDFFVMTQSDEDNPMTTMDSRLTGRYNNG